jgi:adenylosuccinate synthase
MSATCVVGLQWGDEAKGKIVDFLSDEHDYVVRYNGGNNAGHTVVWGERRFALSLLPTGILRSHMTAVIANGVVVYPPKLLDELASLEKAGIQAKDRLRISAQAHVIFPYHIAEEVECGGKAAIGTTGRGIGPCYSDKVNRANGIRMGELLHPEHLKTRLSEIIPRKNKIIKALSPDPDKAPVFEVEKVWADYCEMGEQLRPMITNTTMLLHEALQDRKKILFEAAQGSLLDIDHGTFPYVTSSHSLPSGIWSGSGVPARQLKRIIGVAKAYTTRVGSGPCPTELNDGPDGIGERIRKVGREYGTVTGRPRRVGWFDALAVRYSAAIAGCDEITIMLLDVLSGLEEIKVCVGYEYEGKKINYFLSDGVELAKCKPIYETLQGWKEDISKARKLEDLPVQARRYVQFLSDLIGLPVSVISVGPDREQTILNKIG